MCCSNTLNSEINSKATKTFECDGVLLFSLLLLSISKSPTKHKKWSLSSLVRSKIAIILLAVLRYHKLLKCISARRDTHLHILSDTPHNTQNTTIKKVISASMCPPFIFIRSSCSPLIKILSREHNLHSNTMKGGIPVLASLATFFASGAFYRIK